MLIKIFPSIDRIRGVAEVILEKRGMDKIVFQYFRKLWVGGWDGVVTDL